MLDINKVLTSRLSVLGKVAEKGVIPGQLDTYDLEQTIGRIKELKLVLKLLRGSTG